MNGSFLLDTNIISALFAGEQIIQDRIAKIGNILTSVIVIGELSFGAQKSPRMKENILRIHRFMTKAMVLDCNAGTAYEYGLIRNELRLKGLPIPENDLWLSATARQHDLTLVSRDRHFEYVDGLVIERW